MNRSEIENQLVQVALEIPSGEIVFNDSLNEAFPEKTPYYINELKGVKQTILFYGNLKLLHGFVGNSSPSIYKHNDKIYLGSKSDENSPLIPGTKVGQISTDLWWYSLADRAEYLRRGGSKKTPFFTVTPGRYILKHRLSSNGWEMNDRVYATLELSEAPVENTPLPEETMRETFLNLMPDKYKNGDEHFWLDVIPQYERKGSGFLREDFVFTGYEASFGNKLYLGKHLYSPEEFNSNPEEVFTKLLEKKSNLKKIHEIIDVMMKCKYQLSDEDRKIIDEIKARSDEDYEG